MSLIQRDLDTSWGLLTVAGASRAGDGTLFLLPQLRLALDAGRPHRALPPLATVCVSHGHLDHIGGVGYWASQRFLQAMGPATLVAPRAIADDLRTLLVTLARLEGGAPYQIEVEPVDDGSVRQVRRDLELEFVRTDHWVETLGSTLWWHRRRLRDDLADSSETEIAARRVAGEDVTRVDRVALLAYCADTGPALFDRRPDLLEAEILVVECSFFKPGDRDRARQYGHMHLEDLVSLAQRFSGRHLILIHASRRHRLREVEAILAETIAPVIQARLHHLIADWA